MATTAATPIRFRGSPPIVEGLARLTPPPALTVAPPLALNLPRAVRQETPLTLRTYPVGSAATRLELSLPESTPPGTYEGTMQIGDESYPIVVEVEPRPYLVISPRQLSFQVTPGAEASVHLTLFNSGNVPCEIGRVYAFGLFDVKGADRSIGAALGDLAEQEHSGHVIDEATGSRGLVRVNVREGAGVIELGELQNLRATLHFSDQLKPGNTYSGIWPLFNLEYSVRVYVISPSTAVKSPRKQKESS